MAKKVKSDDSGIDEANRTMYATFCNAANSLSQLYTQADSQQKLAFQAGEYHALEKMHQWILRQEEDGKRITGADVILHLQEFNFVGEVTSLPCGCQRQQPPNFNSYMYYPNPSTQTEGGSLGLLMDSGMKLLSAEQARQSVCFSGLSCPTTNHAQLGQLTSKARWAGLEVGLEHGVFDTVECSSPNKMGTNGCSTHIFPQRDHQDQDIGSVVFHESAMDM